MHTFIKRQCYVTTPTGEKFTTDVGIAQPIELMENHWKCDIILTPILRDERAAFGWDALDAVQNAVHLLYVELKFRETFGWEFGWADGSLMGAEEILPAVGRSSAEPDQR